MVWIYVKYLSVILSHKLSWIGILKPHNIASLDEKPIVIALDLAKIHCPKL